jgi:S1-C subfamily serine protease
MGKNVSTPSQVRAKLGLHGVADMDVVKALTAAWNGVLNNSAYPNSPIDLAVFKAGIDKFSALIVDAEDGGKKAISAKDKQRVAVIKLYTQLGHYVQSACNDDMATFLTSGFTAAAKRTNPAPLPLTEAAFSSIDRGPNSGDVVVKPDGQKGAVAFDVRYALQGGGGPLGPWTTVTIVKPRRVTISGLSMAGIYQFQIRALGVLGYTDWMDTKIFVVA